MKQIPLFKVFMSETVPTAVGDVLMSGYIGQGSKVEEFEVMLKTFLENDLVLTTASGTSAEHLAVNLLKRPAGEYCKSDWGGLKDSDVVLASPLTCTASNFPLIMEGMRIRWVDIDEKTLNVDLDDLARKLDKDVRLMLIPLWGGMPVDFAKLAKIQERAYRMYGVKAAVIIDAAHGFGSKFNGVHVCSQGHIAFYSFQAIKHLTCVDGGGLVLPYYELYKRGKLMRWYGIDRDTNRKDFRCEANIEEVGTKWHMNDVNATVGIENMKAIKPVLARYKDNAKFYNEALLGVGGVRVIEAPVGAESAYWLYTILVDRQPDFTRMMKEKGVAVSRVHERNDKHSCTAAFQAQLPTLDRVVSQMICIPSGWWVTDEDRQYVVDCIKGGW